MATISRGSNNFVQNDRRSLIKAERSVRNERNWATSNQSTSAITNGAIIRDHSTTLQLSSNSGRTDHGTKRGENLRSGPEFNSYNNIGEGRDFHQHFNSDDSSFIISYSLDPNRKRDVVDLSIEKAVCSCCGRERTQEIIAAPDPRYGSENRTRDITSSSRPEIETVHHVAAAERLQGFNSYPMSNQNRAVNTIIITNVENENGWDSLGSRANPNNHYRSIQSSPRTNHLAARRARLLAEEMQGRGGNGSQMGASSRNNTLSNEAQDTTRGVKRPLTAVSTSSDEDHSQVRMSQPSSALTSREEPNGGHMKKGYINAFYVCRPSDDNHDKGRSNDVNAGWGKGQSNSTGANSEGVYHTSEKGRSANTVHSNIDERSDGNYSEPGSYHSMTQNVEYLRWRQQMNDSVRYDGSSRLERDYPIPDSPQNQGHRSVRESSRSINTMEHEEHRQRADARQSSEEVRVSDGTPRGMESGYVNSDFKGRETKWDDFDRELFRMKHFISTKGGCISDNELEDYMADHPLFLEKMHYVLATSIERRNMTKIFNRNPAWGMNVISAVLQGKFVRRPTLYSIESTKESRETRKRCFPLLPMASNTRQHNRKHPNTNCHFDNDPPPLQSKKAKNKENRAAKSSKKNVQKVQAHAAESGSRRRKRKSNKLNWGGWVDGRATWTEDNQYVDN